MGMENALTTVSSSPVPQVAFTAERLIEAFARGRSANTVKAYQTDLRSFAKWSDCETPADAARLLLGNGAGHAHDLALEWQASLLDEGFAPNSVNRKLASLQALVRAAAERDVIPWRLSIPRLTVKLVRDTRGPLPETFDQMCELAGRQKDRFLAARDVCIFRMLRDMGLRQGELRTLDLEHVDLEDLKLSILGKGKRERALITIPRVTADILRAWLEQRGDHPGALITSRWDKDARLDSSCILRVVATFSDAAGRRTTPHGLRHLAITEVARITEGNVFAVAAFSRHADIRVVQTYIDGWKDTAGDLANRLADGD